jgi:RND superfamily putative drug exporter
MVRHRQEEARAPLVWRVYGGLTAYLGPVIVAGWVAACAAAVIGLPDIGTLQGSGLLQLVPSNAPSLHAEARETQLFGNSLAESQAVVVTSDPRGMSPQAALAVARHALAVDTHPPASAHPSTPLFALPIVDTGNPLTLLRGGATGTITYLGFPSQATAGDVDTGAHRYAASLPAPPGALVGVTGPIPAQIEEGNAIDNALPVVEAVSVAVIAVLVGVVFRSPVAPTVPLAGTAITYLVSRHVIGWAAHRFGVGVPPQLDPIMVVLLLGVVTDYSVFTLTGMRARLALGERRTAALRHTASRVVPLVAAAALTVAAGTVALIGTSLSFFRALGPGLAVAVVIAGAVSVSFVPALVALLGRAAFWPSRGATPPPPPPPPPPPSPAPQPRDLERVVGVRPSARGRIAALLAHRPVAAVVVVLCLLVVGAAGSGIATLRLGSDLISGLPGDSGARTAAQAAASAFPNGIVAPSTMIIESPGVAGNAATLQRIHQVVSGTPGVAAALGPGQLPLLGASPLFRTSNGSAVRMVVVFRDDPYDGPAIAAFTALRSRVQAALPGAGLPGATVLWSGATPTAYDAAAASSSDVWRVALLAALLMAVVLIVYFRAVIAALLLIVSSAAALAAPLGLLVYVFQGAFGYPDITFFVPVAGGVLLVSLGADYSVFVMGRIWEEARAGSMAQAVSVALPRASRAVSVAAFTLAASFAVLALVPVAPFQEMAFMMAIGVLIDAFMVRSYLLPGLLVLVGPRAFWPHLRPPASPAAAVAPPPAIGG